MGLWPHACKVIEGEHPSAKNVCFGNSGKENAANRRRNTRISSFKNATLLITGGTGSFGHTVLKHFLYSDIGQIRIFSRDEKKQDNMRHELQAQHPDVAGKVKFYIGNVRDHRAVRDSMDGVDYIFHAAALNQVPSCEFFRKRKTIGSHRQAKILFL